jgi:hypothetical protein
MAAAVIQGCEIGVESARGKLRYLKSWPECSWMNFHIESTRWTPERNLAGFSRREL